MFPVLLRRCARRLPSWTMPAKLAAGGATLIQYRNKVGTTREMLSDARELRRALGEGVTLIMNDRADICIAAELQRSACRPGRSLARRRAHGDRSEPHPRRLDAQPGTTEGSRRRSGGLHRLRPGISRPRRSAIPIPSSGSTAFAPRVPLPRSRWSPSAASPAPTRVR